MKDYGLFIYGAWGFAAVVLTLLFVSSWRGLHKEEKKNAEKT